MVLKDAFNSIVSTVASKAIEIATASGRTFPETEDKEPASRQWDKKPWEETDYVSHDGTRQDTWPEGMEYAEENERLKAEFHVYINSDGRYQMEESYRNACEELGYDPEDLQGKYVDVGGTLKEQYTGSKKVYDDIEMWEMAHDPAYLSSLDTEGLGMFMAEYEKWAAEHVMEPLPDEKEPKVVFGTTIKEYQAMDSAGREEIDNVAAACHGKYISAFDKGIEEYVPQTEDGELESGSGQAKSTGFWDDLKNRVSETMTVVRKMLESTSVGAWVVDTYDNVKEAVTGLVRGSDEKEADSLTEAYAAAEDGAKNPTEAVVKAQNPGQEKHTEGRGYEPEIQISSAGNEPILTGDYGG